MERDLVSCTLCVKLEISDSYKKWQMTVRFFPPLFKKNKKQAKMENIQLTWQFYSFYMTWKLLFFPLFY